MTPTKLAPNVVTIIQTRCGSSRFPNKVVQRIGHETILEKMMERVMRARLVGRVVVATTESPTDDVIEEICKLRGYPLFRGNENDLIDRHLQAAKRFNADLVVKIPSDCPLIDPRVIDRVIDHFMKAGDLDYCSNLHPATYPDGNDVEIFTIEALEKANTEAKKDFEREHTTPYFWENPDKFKTANVEYKEDFSMSHRWVLDYPEDFQFISAVFQTLYPENPRFDLEDVLSLVRRRPDIAEVNAKYNGVNWYRNHMDELKTVKPTETRSLESEA